MPKDTLIAVTKGQLVPTEPSVTAIAKRFNWRPETLIARIERALPAPVEQELFLTLTSHMDIGITPEKFSNLLRMATSAPLRIEDLQQRIVGPNLAISKIDNIGDFLQAALELLGKLTNDLEVSLSVDQAGKLALVFGESALPLIEQIHEKQEIIARKLNYGRGYQFAHLAHETVERLLDHVSAGRIHPIDIMEIFGYMDEALDEAEKEGG